MSDVDDLVRDTAQRIFADLGAPQAIILAGDDSWQAPLWSALEEAGLHHAWLPEEFGGAGLSVADTFTILQVAGGYAVAVPLAETLLGGWALARAGLTPPPGRLSVAPVRPGDRLMIDDDGRLSGSVHGVPFAREADHLVVLAEDDAGDRGVACIAREAAEIDAVDGIAGEPRDSVRFDDVEPSQAAASEIDVGDLCRLGAAMRAMQMAGAMQAVLDMAVTYARERIAFGRPIGRFQAVQHLLARLAEETAAAQAAASSAAHAIETLPSDDVGVFVEVASAKVRAGEAAGEAAMIGHQVHGAIGFTDEHVLHRYVQRLWSWRDDFGSEAEWAQGLGRFFAGQDGADFWPTITAI